MAATAAVPPNLGSLTSGGGDHEDSNISSPLSEVDYKDANDEDIRINIGEDEGEADEEADDNGDDESSLTEEDINELSAREASDSESALSDARSVAGSNANDTEAETERLFDTPQHQRHKDVLVDGFNNSHIFEHTPSKLRRRVGTGNINEITRHGLILEGDDVVSGTSSQGDKENSPSKPTIANDSSVDDDDLQNDSQDRKRKRSLIGDNSDPEQPLRKRTGSVGAKEEPEGTLVHGELPFSDRDQHMDHAEDTYINKYGSEQGAAPEREERVPRKAMRGSRRRGGVPSKGEDEVVDEIMLPEAVVTVEDVVEPHEEGSDEADEEADTAAKNAVEAERKVAAYKDWTHIEELFGVFRDRLYKDRLRRLEEEEQALLADEPTHPEYLNMKKCLDDRLNQKLQEIDNEREFRQRANERRSVAIRAQIWSQFYQAVRETREATLENLNAQWYDVQAARRSAHSMPDYGLLFPKDAGQRVRNVVAYNTEVSTLAGIAKYEGFPAGPEVKGASNAEVDEDFRAIERSRRLQQQQQQPLLQPRHLLSTREITQVSLVDRPGIIKDQFYRDISWVEPSDSAYPSKAYQSLAAQQDGNASAGSSRHGSQQATSGPSPSPTKLVGTTPLNRLSGFPRMARPAISDAAAQPKRSPMSFRPELKPGGIRGDGI